MTGTSDGAPTGGPHEWFRRSRDLLERGDAGASLILIERVLQEDPTSLAAREIRARALFDSQHFNESAKEFGDIVERCPDDDYAHYGLGMSLWRLQQFPDAADHLALACVMRPNDDRYSRALGQVRATLRAREEADLPLSGPIRDADDSSGPASTIVPGTLIEEIWPGLSDPGAPGHTTMDRNGPDAQGDQPDGLPS